MKRIAVQLTQNPFTDDKIGNLSFKEAYQQVKMFCEDILALLETDITDYIKHICSILPGILQWVYCGHEQQCKCCDISDKHCLWVP